MTFLYRQIAQAKAVVAGRVPYFSARTSVAQALKVKGAHAHPLARKSGYEGGLRERIFCRVQEKRLCRRVFSADCCAERLRSVPIGEIAERSARENESP